MSDWSIGPDGSPIYAQKGGQNPLEIDQKGPEIDQNGPDFPLMVEAPSPSGCRIVLRVDPGYYGWVQGLADRLGLNITQTVAQGLLRLAEASGYHYAMPTRYTPKNPGRRRRHPRPGESS